MRNVIILGSGRSGTSMLAGTLAAAGYELGGTPYAAREANPKGFFETSAVNGVNEELLASALPRHPRYAAGQRWLCELPLDARLTSTPDLDARIARLASKAPWCFKDPRFCYTLPVWRPHLGDALHLCVFRDPAVTAQSIVKECKTEPYLKSLAMFPDRALAVWTSMYRHVLEKHAREGEWRFVHYEQLLEREGLERLAEWTGAPIDFTFPEAQLDRSRSTRAVSREAAAVYAELCARAGHAPRRIVHVAGSVPGASTRGSASTAASAPTGTDVASGTGTNVSAITNARTDSSVSSIGGNATAPRLSVVLCTYDRKAILAKSLASWAAQRCAPNDFEVVVVNDGSTDGTREWLEANPLSVPGRVLHRPNGGLAAARNTGIAAARGEFLLFVNDDTIASPDLVAQHLAAHDAEAREGRAALVLGTFEQPLPALDSALMRYLEVSDFVFRYSDTKDGETYDFQRFWTCNVSVRAEHVRAVGGFDESFKVYGAEDIDLGFRLHARGLRVLYRAAARAQHDHVLDFDTLKKRQRVCAGAFVHLFHKEPRCLAHPDWSWVHGKSVEDLERAIDDARSRVPALETAARELARVDLGALDAAEAQAGNLVGETLRSLGRVMQELNGLWWMQGFADGLRRFGYDGFPALLARLPSIGRSERALADDELEDRILALRDLAGAGEGPLATIEAIRLVHAVGRAAAGTPRAALEAELLNDLAVLRFQAEDGEGAVALLEEALRRAPGHALASANLADVGRAVARFTPRWGEGPDAEAKPTSLNPWVREALQLGANTIGFTGRDVLEVGGAIPAETALALRPARWVAGYPGADAMSFGPYERRELDARGLAFPDATFDVIFSSCAFEHINDFDRALAEMRRVLKPGGAIVTHFAPIWSCAVGHHLWETDGNGRRVMFLDRVVPDFAHLLLSEAELRGYLELVLGVESAARCTEYIVRHPCINRVFEGEFRRMFRAAGFDDRELLAQTPWHARHVPSPRLAAELRRAHPDGGDFSTPGFRGTLRVPGTLARTRRGAPQTVEVA
ncbi:MAG: glycosyltransferase [Planctomycetes bacterium]|nr:glycosyltransferase [Planctomycetota bacterium]